MGHRNVSPLPVDTSDAEQYKVATGTETAPTTASHGIDVGPYTECALYLDVISVTAGTVHVYGYNGVAWVDSTDDIITLTTLDVIKNYNVSGLTRLAARVIAITGTSITRTLVPS